MVLEISNFRYIVLAVSDLLGDNCTDIIASISYKIAWEPIWYLWDK